jgi:hypothetical protein
MRVAAVFDVMTHRSHANVVLENFLTPYPFRGTFVDPRDEFKIVSLCTDDLTWADSADPAKRKNFASEVADAHGIPLYTSIRDALCNGTGSLAVDAVLSIGEGGGAGLYGTTELGVPRYPRKRFFDECTAVMREAGRFVPLFNDKHLSYSWDHAQEMCAVAKREGFGLMAGSSIVLCDRWPALGPEIEADGARIADAVVVHGGPLESYDFHGCELLQSIVERRGPRGRAAGVQSVQLVEGEAAIAGLVATGRLDPALVTAAMAAEDAVEGTATAAAGQWTGLKPTASAFLAPATQQFAPHALLIEYRDGLKAAVLRVGDDNARWNAAFRVGGGGGTVRACRCLVGPWRNRFNFKAFAHAIQAFLRSGGTAPYPVERTLLVTGLLEAAMQSRRDGGSERKTPHLEFGYDAPLAAELVPLMEDWSANCKLLDPSIDYRKPMFMDDRWPQLPEPMSALCTMEDYQTAVAAAAGGGGGGSARL